MRFFHGILCVHMRTLLKSLIVPFAFFALITCLYHWRIGSSFAMHPDFGRDLYEIGLIAHGDIAWLGPKSTFGGLYTSPLYYYLMAPALLLAPGQFESLLYANAAYFILGLVGLYVLCLRKHTALASLVVTITAAFLPLYIQSARGPWNGHSYLPFLLVLFAMVWDGEYAVNWRWTGAVGLLFGVVVTMNFSTILILLPIAGFVLMRIKDKRWIGLFLISATVAALPLLLFELTHQFVMMRNTFLEGSYSIFSVRPGDSVRHGAGIVGQMIGVHDVVSRSLGVPLIACVAGILALSLTGKRSKSTVFWVVLVIAPILFFVWAWSSAFGGHYLYSVTLLVWFVLVSLLLERNLVHFITILLVLEIMSFPQSAYVQSERSPATQKLVVDALFKRQILKEGEQQINVLELGDPIATSATGNGYRYYLMNHHVQSDPVSAYGSSRKLVIFSEYPSVDFASLHNYELDQFGLQYVKGAERYRINDTMVYVLQK